jgi:UDP-glucose 4-epimerase
MAVYGDAPVPMTEATPLLPADPYGIAKHCVELDLRAAHEMFGLDYTIFRPHNVYGPKQNIRDRYRNVIGIFMNQIMHDEPMTVFGDGLQTRAFSYIDDVAPLIARCIRVPDSENETFNIGADEPYSVMALANAVAAAMGTDPMVKHLPPRLEVRDAFTSHDKLRAVFGAQWSVPLDIGLKAMAEWARLRGPSKPTYFDRVELTEGLPAVWSV